MDELGKLVVEASGDVRSKTFLIQRTGIEVQRGNSASVLLTIPSGKFFICNLRSIKFHEQYFIK